MSNYDIFLKPIYSAPASEVPQDIELPAGWGLSWHQLETFKAIQDPNIDVIFNTAMTGDGKTLAAFLCVLYGHLAAVALYPTNELARDQEGQIGGYTQQLQLSQEPRLSRLSGEVLEIYAETEGLRKSAAIETRASQSEILLTNPDIFHYLHRGAYLTKNSSPDSLWNRLDKKFDLFIFDEFHVFSAPQIASVINTLLLIRCTNRRKKFLFLSATPNEDLLKRLKLAGFRCQEINPVSENKYRFPDREEECHELEAQGWRQVSRGIQLEFISLEPTANASETWLKENSQLILSQFQEYPGSKGAIVLNSIAAVKRLTPFFQELLAPHGLVVAENTGLTGKEQKERSLLADLVLGTSTIDVGVDFKINFLIFESADAGSFIQRLGRLGRHDSYEKEGETIHFKKFTAYALSPNYLVERLFQGESAPLVSGGTCDRVFFHETIREKYRQINNFQGYYKRWGAVQSMKLCQQLTHPTIKEQYADASQVFKKACEDVFDTLLKKKYGQVKGWQEEWQQLSGKDKGNPIAEDATSFRGSSPLQCGLYDVTESNEGDRFKTYDLPGALSHLDIEPMTEVAFMRLIEETAQRTGKPIAKGRFKHCLGFMKLRGYREEKEDWNFIYPGNLQAIADAWKVQVLVGIQVWQPPNPWIREINQQLKKQGLVCYVIPRPVAEVRSRLRLPMHFQIYPIKDQSSLHDKSADYAIAFSQSALLLDTLAYWFKSKGGEVWVV
ncbi:type I-D CRISPR-associated helicase Cas3' [Oscillatoria sp. HE19RPO]|uniref:type I-D CRISPR-associated helicase Cas3' n=1 Tax=Oscillatoria sp. HE19RPO TaxID=2954806 RepID=UPI0020C41138|nr:type I-D CRISPR-associated helicase Cas3' [Oscillatoria sp. HE19RPO]